MSSTMLKNVTVTLLSLAALLSVPANANNLTLDLNLNLENMSALTRLTDSDWKLLKATAKDSLNNTADGTSHVWENPETSHAGVITVLSTDEHDGRFCRNTRFINTTGELTSTTVVNLCKQDDKWVEASPRSTTTATKEPLSNSSPSLMLNDSPAVSTEVTSKRLGQTSDYCRELFQNIDKLKGKPVRRSAAIDLHKAECLR